MKVITAEGMRFLDRSATEEFGISIDTLMEAAGRRVAEELELAFGPPAGMKIAVVAGKGNNGGDGFVAARYLLERSAQVVVYLLSSPMDVRGEAKTNLERYQQRSGPVRIVDAAALAHLASDLAENDLIVDALFGMGISSALQGAAARIVDAINASGKPVVSVDIPSGIHADTGRVMGAAVRATVTVTFALPKLGLLIHPGLEFSGRIRVADIGIPEEAIRRMPSTIQWLSPPEISARMKDRPGDAHKGGCGHVLVIAGSTGKGGAAVMTALSALRSGAGLTTLAMPAGLEAALPNRPMELMTLPLPQTGEGTLAFSALEPILKFAHDKTVAAIGPGLSTHPETVRLVQALLTHLAIPIVLDADGINALAGHPDFLKQARSKIVLTPHPGEMARLNGTSTRDIQSNRPAAAAEFVGRYPATLVLKGAGTVIAERAGQLTLNTTGNPAMATAGTGDVLTGIIAGLMAQGYDDGEAALLGVYLHGLAGDLASAKMGGIGMLAGDLIAAIPAARASAMNPKRESP